MSIYLQVPALDVCGGSADVSSGSVSSGALNKEALQELMSHADQVGPNLSHIIITSRVKQQNTSLGLTLDMTSPESVRGRVLRDVHLDQVAAAKQAAAAASQHVPDVVALRLPALLNLHHGRSTAAGVLIVLCCTCWDRWRLPHQLWALPAITRRRSCSAALSGPSQTRRRRPTWKMR